MPARLDKRPANCRTLEQELTISVKQLLVIMVFAIFFLIFIFMSTPQTYGFL